MTSFGVLSYVYDDRYVLNANIRSDGSNKFGSNPKYRWLPTWSFAFKWNLMNESFMQGIGWINNLALRGSYGIQGNIHEDATPYLIVTTGSRDDVLGLPTSTITKLPNPDLRWEKTHSWNAALDFTLLGGRIQGGIDFYGKNTSDLIMSKSVASSTGRSVLYYNAGKMVNKGVEGFLNVRMLKNRDWEWRMGINFGRNVNEITYANPEDLNDTEIVDQMLVGSLPVKGQPIGTLYSYRFAGLNQETGLPMFYTKEGRLSLLGNKNDMELVACGSIFPKLVGGFDTQLNYRNFSLSLNFTYSLGSVARLPEYYLNTMDGMDPLANLDADWLRSWKQPGDVTDIPAPYNVNKLFKYLATESGTPYQTYDYNLGNERIYCAEMYGYSDRQVAKADFLKLKMVAFSYNFPTQMLKRFKISSLMLRLQATNLFTVADKKWNGLDPESGICNIPALPTYSLGVNISF